MSFTTPITSAVVVPNKSTDTVRPIGFSSPQSALASDREITARGGPPRNSLFVNADPATIGIRSAAKYASSTNRTSVVGASVGFAAGWAGSCAVVDGAQHANGRVVAMLAAVTPGI